MVVTYIYIIITYLCNLLIVKPSVAWVHQELLLRRLVVVGQLTGRNTIVRNGTRDGPDFYLHGTAIPEMVKWNFNYRTNTSKQQQTGDLSYMADHIEKKVFNCHLRHMALSDSLPTHLFLEF